MKYNLLQKRHDLLVRFFEENLINKDTYFMFESKIEQHKELYIICLN